MEVVGNKDESWIFPLEEEVICDVYVSGCDETANTPDCLPKKLNLPLQKGFVISRRVCMEYFRLGRQFPYGFHDQYVEAVRILESETNKSFGGLNSSVSPLLLSVRGLAPSEEFSTAVFDIGMTDITMNVIAKLSGNYRFSLETYIEFLKKFGITVLNIDPQRYDLDSFTEITSLKMASMASMSITSLEALVVKYKNITFHSSSDEPWMQLKTAIKSVIDSFIEKKSCIGINTDLPLYLESDIIVQVMVHGNRNENSGKGFVFSRNPASGNSRITGEYTEYSIERDSCALNTPLSIESLVKCNTQLYCQLEKLCRFLELKYRDMQTIEFVVEDRRLYVLKSWAGSRSAEAAVRIITDLVKENIITVSAFYDISSQKVGKIKEALFRCCPKQIQRVSSKSLRYPLDDSNLRNMSQTLKHIGYGHAVSNGFCIGYLVSDETQIIVDNPSGYIMIIDEYLGGKEALVNANGYICLRGGIASPLAYYSRNNDKPMLTGVAHLFSINSEGMITLYDGTLINSNLLFCIDGNTGLISMSAERYMLPEYPSCLYQKNVSQILEWSGNISRVKIIVGINNVTNFHQAKLLSGVLGTAVISLNDLVEKNGFGTHLCLIYWILLNDKLLQYQSVLYELKMIIRGVLCEIFSEMSMPLESSNQINIIRLISIEYDTFSGAAFLSLAESYFVDIQNSESNLKRQYSDFTFLLELQIEAITTTFNRKNDDLLPTQIHLIIENLCNHDKTSELFSIVTEVIQKNSCSSNIMWKLGFIIEVPAACFNIEKGVMLLSPTTYGSDLFILFDLQKLLGLLMGINISQDLVGPFKTDTISISESSEVIEFLGEIVKKMRTNSLHSNFKIGFILSSDFDIDAVVRICDRLEADWVICSIDEATGALLSSAQICLEDSLRY